MDKDDEELEDLNYNINELMSKMKKYKLIIVMRDFNAKLRKTSVFVEFEMFANTKNFIVSNTWFKQLKRRFYTWKSPMDQPNSITRYKLTSSWLKKVSKIAVYL